MSNLNNTRGKFHQRAYVQISHLQMLWVGIHKTSYANS